MGTGTLLKTFTSPCPPPEAVRQRAPTCAAVIDEKGWITLHQRWQRTPSSSSLLGSAAPSGSNPPSGTPTPGGESGQESRQANAAARHFAFSARRARLASILALTVVAWGGRSVLQIRTTGAPWGSSMRAGNTVVTLMTRLEPYLPSLTRNHGTDRYSVGLLLHEADNGRRRYVEIARRRAPRELSQAKLLPVQGTRVWVQAPEPMLHDLASDRLAGPDELQRDPSLAPPERYVAVSDLAVGDRATMLFLATAGKVKGNRWLAVHAPGDILRGVGPR